MLVPTDPEVCSACGARYEELAWAEPALLIHGGAGHTVEHRVRACACATIHETGSSSTGRRHPVTR